MEPSSLFPDAWPKELRIAGGTSFMSSTRKNAVIEYPFALPRPTRLEGLDEVSNIQVTTVRNGKIVASRDYHNHAALADSVGRLQALVTAMSSAEG